MEKVIRIQSDNSVVQTFNNSTTVPTQKLFDFTIPRGAVFDLSRSYVSVNIQPKVDNNSVIGGVVPLIRTVSEVRTQATTGESHVGKQNILVRNAQLYSQTKGMLESIRNQSTLALAKHYLEKDLVEVNRDLDLLGSCQDDVGIGELSSYYTDEVKVCEGAEDITTRTSRVIARDHKIYLKDVFGIAKSNLYSTDVYGDTKIHWEMNLDKFFFKLAQGDEALSTKDDIDQPAQLAANAVVTSVTTTKTTEDPHQEGVFFVGQSCRVRGTGSVGGRATDVTAIITKAVYSTTTKKMTYTFNLPLITVGGAVETWSGITMIGSVRGAGDAALVFSTQINGAELVLVEVKDAKNVPSEHDYITYSTEELNGNSLNPLNKQLKIEPNAQSLYICSCDNGQIAPDRAINKYRMAINNIDVSGNRDIVFDSQLNKDRLIRAYRNKNVTLKDIRQKMNKLSILQLNRDDDPNATIVETMPLTDQEKTVNLELTNSANVQEVRCFK